MVDSLPRSLKTDGAGKNYKKKKINYYSHHNASILQVEKHRDNLGALMITYPSTSGVFEKEVR